MKDQKRMSLAIVVLVVSRTSIRSIALVLLSSCVICPTSLYLFMRSSLVIMNV